MPPTKKIHWLSWVTCVNVSLLEQIMSDCFCWHVGTNIMAWIAAFSCRAYVYPDHMLKIIIHKQKDSSSSSYLIFKCSLWLCYSNNPLGYEGKGRLPHLAGSYNDISLWRLLPCSLPFDFLVRIEIQREFQTDFSPDARITEETSSSSHLKFTHICYPSQRFWECGLCVCQCCVWKCQIITWSMLAQISWFCQSHERIMIFFI